MVIQMNIAEAKAKLSELVDAAAAGDEVVIARSGRAMVRLVPIGEPGPRELGFLPLDIDEAMFARLTEDELSEWE